MNLNQVTIPSIDVEKSVQYYQKLGLNLIVKSTDHYARFESPEGQATFSIHEVKQLPNGEGVYVYFECKNLDIKVAELKKMGIVFEEDPNDKDWLWREARLKDPDGNQLILYYAGENRLNPPWRLNNEEIKK
jgi:catechol 2,3-dioxygenase-like lactoylglutathione lyase family enzyme